MNPKQRNTFVTTIEDKDWLYVIKKDNKVDFSKSNGIILMQELERGYLESFITFLRSCGVHIGSNTNESGLIKYTIPLTIEIPNLDAQKFLNLLKHYVISNTNLEEDDSLLSIQNRILSFIFEKVKIVSGENHPLHNLVEQIKQNHNLDQVNDHINNFMAIQEWNDFFSDKIDGILVTNITISNWLHVVRHPTKAMFNLNQFILNHMNSSTSPGLLSTSIPLVGYDKHTFLILTVPETSTTLLPNDEEQTNVKDSILSYWFSLTSVILRNLNYALVKFNELTLSGVEMNEIAFYEYFKPKLAVFSESCYNDDLVEGFKNQDGKHKLNKLLYGHEFFIYNRGAYLEKNYKQSKREFNRKPYDKIVRKRFNRRKKKLYEFFSDFIQLYLDYLNEVASKKLISGKYKSIKQFNN